MVQSICWSLREPRFVCQGPAHTHTVIHIYTQFETFNYVSICITLWVCTEKKCSVNGGQKRVLDSLQLELQVTVRCPMWVLGTKLGSPIRVCIPEPSLYLHIYIIKHKFTKTWYYNLESQIHRRGRQLEIQSEASAIYCGLETVTTVLAIITFSWLNEACSSHAGNPALL